MATLPITHLETHPDGTTGVAGIVNSNWGRLETVFDPALSAADASYGAFWKAVVRSAATPSNGQAIVWDTALGKPKFDNVSGQGIQAAIMALSPFLYYPCNETSGTAISDASGNSRHAVISGAYTLNQAGPPLRGGVSKAIAMTAARITTGGAVFNHTDWTAMAWVKLTGAIPTAAPMSLWNQREGASSRISTYISATRAAFESWNGTTTGNFTLNPAGLLQVANEWVHVAITKTNTNPSSRVLYYVNGFARGDAGQTLAAVTDKPLTFGASSTAFAEPFIGSVSNIAYFDRALTEAQIHSCFIANP